MLEDLINVRSEFGVLEKKLEKYIKKKKLRKRKIRIFLMR
jgi:hypothetical protein